MVVTLKLIPLKGGHLLMVEKKRRDFNQKDKREDRKDSYVKNDEFTALEADDFDINAGKTLKDYILGNASPEREGFDWDSFENGSVTYSGAQKTDLDAIYGGTFTEV